MMQLGGDGFQETGFGERAEGLLRVASAQDLVVLLQQPGRRAPCDLVPKRPNRLDNRLIDGEIEPGGECDRSEHPNRILAKTLERIADRMAVAHALAELAERPRRVITLAYIEGLTHQEIAERTGLPLGTIKSDIRRGLVTLRQHLESTHE